MLCSQALGVGATESRDVEYHVTQTIMFLSEKYNLSMIDGKPTGHASSWHQRVFDWHFASTFAPNTVSDAGNVQPLSFCSQNINLSNIEKLMGEVSSCRKLGKKQETGNIIS